MVNIWPFNREKKNVDLDRVTRALMALVGYEFGGYSTRQQLTEGYLKNVIVYRCIKEITDAAGGIGIDVYKNGDIAGEKDPLAVFLTKPNKNYSWKRFVKSALTDYLYSGNCYIVAYDGLNGQQVTAPPTTLPAELEIYAPYEVEVEGTRYNQTAFKFSPEMDGEKRFPIDPLTGLSRILHFKTVNPQDPRYGISPLQPSAFNVDIHNHGSQWNLSLLRNSAAPSGIYRSDQTMGDNEFARLKQEIKDNYSGSKNAGRTLILDGGLQYQQIALSPVDMDFISSLDTAARNIASAFGVPFPLVIPEGSTYNNVKDARVALYENTVIPMLSEFLQELSRWFTLILKQPYDIRLNLESVSALEDKRATAFERMGLAVANGLITINEARTELGYEAILGAADELLVPSSMVALDALNEPMEQIKADALIDYVVKSCAHD